MTKLRNWKNPISHIPYSAIVKPEKKEAERLLFSRKPLRHSSFFTAVFRDVVFLATGFRTVVVLLPSALFALAEDDVFFFTIADAFAGDSSNLKLTLPSFPKAR